MIAQLSEINFAGRQVSRKGDFSVQKAKGHHGLEKGYYKFKDGIIK